MERDLIGFWGYIEPKIIEKYKKIYPHAKFIDLDIFQNAPSSGILPEATCKIITNITDNACFYKNRLIKILASIGKDKCDSGFFVANILLQTGFDVEMTKCEKICEKMPKTPISDSTLPLTSKISLITKGIYQKNDLKLEKCKPQFGFWGVPPNDLSILELFPNNTAVYGWTRAVEAGYPADISLEMYVPEGLPTIFYTQTFCAKNQLAKYLANKYGGLHIDVDGVANNSARAKIEAFLRLR